MVARSPLCHLMYTESCQPPPRYIIRCVVAQVGFASATETCGSVVLVVTFQARVETECGTATGGAVLPIEGGECRCCRCDKKAIG